MEKLKRRLARNDYNQAKSEKQEDLKLHYLFEAINLLAQEDKQIGDSNRQAIRRLIEENSDAFEANVDFEDFVLDVFYERPVFSDLHVEDKDVYYYEDFNTIKAFKANDDNILSIKTFQRILEDSDMASFYMSIYKIHDYIYDQNKNEYSDYETRLIKASNYLLENALSNLLEEEQ